MSFTGTLADINTALSGLTYQGDANYNGSDALAVHIDDLGNTGAGGPLTADASVDINVTAVDDAPVINAPGPQTTAEDASVVINGLSVSDVDANGGAEQVDLSVGQWRADAGLDQSGLSFLTGANGDASMSFTGTLADIDAALSGLSYQGDANYNGSDALAVHIDDLGNTGAGGPLTADASVDINVTAVDDAPVINAPGPQTASEDTSVVINGISVSDVDAGPGTEQVSLTVGHGTLTLGSTSGLSFDSGADGSAAMTFTGTLADINTALSGLTYQGDANYNGSDALAVHIDDLGNTGAGGPLTADASVDITVTRSTTLR